MRIIFSVTAFILFSCTNNEEKKLKNTVDFGAFTIETPSNWKKVEVQGIDSRLGRIAIDNKDTLEFDIGPYSWDLTEYLAIKNGDNKTYYIDANDTAEKPTLFDNSNKHKVVKSTIIWDTVDERRAKIVYSIEPGMGLTGIYIDSLWLGHGSVPSISKFNLYGRKLKAENEKVLLMALKTLRFHRQ